MTRLWRSAVCCAVLLVSDRADAALTVTPVTPLTADLCDACAAPQVRLPIAFGGVDAKATVTVTVRDAALGSRRDSAYTRAITPSLSAADGRFELQITVVDGALRDPGTYSVTLEFASGEEVQRATLQLIRPAAALQPIGTIVVERVLGTPWAASDAKNPPLKLLETSRRTGLTGVHLIGPNPTGRGRINLKQPSVCTDDPPAADSKATPPPAFLTLGPGLARCYGLETAGDLPLGAQTLTYSLSAPELASNVPVTFDVRTHLSTLYVVLYIMLGALAALLVKVLLQERIDLGNARQLALDLRGSVEQDLARHRDQVFVDALTPPLTQLRTTAAGTNVTAITGARTTLDTAWRAALTDLTTRRTAAQQVVDRLRSLTETEWDVPASLRDALTAARVSTDQSRGLLATNDQVSQAAAVATQAVTIAGQTLAKNITAWQDAMSIALDAVAGSASGLSPTMAAVAASASGNAKGRVGSTKLPVAASVQQLVDALSSMTDEVRAVRRFARVLTLALEQEMDRVAATFGRTRAQLPQVVTAVGAVTQALIDGIDSPDRLQAQTLTALTALDAAWRTTFQSIGGTTLSKAVTDLLDQKRVTEAGAALMKELRGDADASAAVGGAPVSPVVIADDTRASVKTFDTRAERDAVPPLLEELQARNRWALARAKIGQSVAVAILAGLIGYGLFAPKFIGDFQDFIMIFFWAFGLDLTTESVVRLAPTSRR